MAYVTKSRGIRERAVWKWEEHTERAVSGPEWFRNEGVLQNGSAKMGLKRVL